MNLVIYRVKPHILGPIVLIYRHRKRQSLRTGTSGGCRCVVRRFRSFKQFSGVTKGMKYEYGRLWLHMIILYGTILLFISIRYIGTWFFFWGVTKRWIYAMIHCRKISRNGFAKSTTAESQALYHSACLFICLFIYFCHLAFGFVWLVRQGKNGCAIFPSFRPVPIGDVFPYVLRYITYQKCPPNETLILDLLL